MFFYQRSRLQRIDLPPANVRIRGPPPQTDDSSLGSFHIPKSGRTGGGSSSRTPGGGSSPGEEGGEDADIDEAFSEEDGGLTTQDDGGESTEPEHLEKTMYFGQMEEKARYV